jgi:ABC-2 type transport system ATP-binding protein
VHTPDVEQAHALLDGGVEARDGHRLVIRGTDPAELNARLVAAGVRVAELAPERRTLEDVVLSVTGAGSDRVARS